MEANQKSLWKHQETAVERAKKLPEYAFLFDPGLGKTRATIEVLKHRYNTEGRVLRTLIVAPMITLQNWRAELLAYMNIPPEKILILMDSGAKREKILATNLFNLDDNKIVITNYEGLLMSKVQPLLIKWRPEIVIADEMHKLKNPNARRSIATRQHGVRARFRYGLTGTAVLNSLMDIFGQWLFLDLGVRFGQNFFAFKNRYFVDKNSKMPRHLHFPKYIPSGTALPQIRSLIEPMSTAAIKSECLDLPPLIKQSIDLEMTPEMRRHYKNLKDDFMTWLKQVDAPVIAMTALTKIIRLMQLTSGFMKTEAGEEILIKDSPKEAALEELLEQILPNKVIVWAVYKRNYETIKRVCDRLGARYVECHGEVSNAKKFEAVAQFEKDPETTVFIGHPQSLGIGINLCAANYMVYFSRSFSLGDDIQSEARNYRAGSEVHEKITRYDLVMRGTVDELCLEALKAKAEISGSLVRDWAEKDLF